MNYLYWLSRLRTVITLAILAGFMIFAVTWGFNRVTQPFPEKVGSPPCINTPVAVDEVLRPGAITVSVLNAGGREGLASRTMDDLTAQGFAQGELDNAPDDAKVRSVAIWTDDRTNPAVRLLRSYLGGKKVQIVAGQGTALGLNVIVGEKFPGVKTGLPQIVAQSEGTVCTPPELS